MIIRKYKLFEEKVNINEELSKLLEMAVDTEELDLVKFFVDRGAKSENALEKAAWNDTIFRYLLHKKMPLTYLDDRRINNTDVQKALIEYGHHEFIDKNTSFLKNLKNEPKYKQSVDNYFRKNPSVDAFEWAEDNKELCLELLNSGFDYESLPPDILKEPEVQKALIDFGKDQFVYQKVGFADELKKDPKYKDYVEMAKDFGKFNL